MAVPSETVYGLAANALDENACRRIFAAKGRPSTDPLIVHVLDVKAAEHLAEFNEPARKLAAAFWPGPLTLVLPKRSPVSDVVTSGLPSVAVRVPRHPVFRQLLRAARCPLAAPSANPFGYISPTTAQHVVEGLGGRIAHVLDGGACAVGVESTIVDVRNPHQVSVLRPGMISSDDISSVLGLRVGVSGRRASRRARAAQLSAQAPRGKRSTRGANSESSPDRYGLEQGDRRVTPAADGGAQLAPGMLTRHYSPRTALRLVRRIRPKMTEGADSRTAFLFFHKPDVLPSRLAPKQVNWLTTPRGGEAQAARRLFAVLRQLDAGEWDLIIAERAPDTPKGRALNDRLRRAAALG